MTVSRRDAGLMPWQIIWRDRVEKARELAAIGRGDAREDWNFSADEILAIDADRRAMTDLWAKHGDRADALETVLESIASDEKPYHTCEHSDQARSALGLQKRQFSDHPAPASAPTTRRASAADRGGGDETAP